MNRRRFRVLTPLYRVHGHLVSKHLLSGKQEIGLMLRAVRFCIDLLEMTELYGLRGAAGVLFGTPR